MQLGPNVYVGAGVVIGAGARVREAIILDRAVIQVSHYKLKMSNSTSGCVCLPSSGTQLCAAQYYWMGMCVRGVVTY